MIASADDPPQSRGGQSAHDILRAAASTLQLEKWNSLHSVSFKGIGSEYSSAEVQGYNPEQRSSADYEEELVLFPSQDRLVFEHRTGKGDDTVRWRRWLYTATERIAVDFLAREVYPRRNQPTLTERVRLSRRIPHVLILESTRDDANVELLNDSAEYLGRPHYVVAFTPPNEKVTLKLFIDRRTHLLSKYEYAIDFPVLGDVTIENTYSDYSKHPELGWVARRQSITIAGKTYHELRHVTVTVNAPQADSLFEVAQLTKPPGDYVFRLPERLRNLVAKPGDIMEIAPGVNVLQVYGFTVMFVEFTDFILAVEAPALHPSVVSTPPDEQLGSGAVASEVIHKIKQQVPGKPIRYLVMSHFHSDHTGGAREFIAEGATIVTTTNNRRFFQQMADAPHYIRPDRLSIKPMSARVETFRRRRSITDGARTVELINVGPNPHTGESVVVYLPKEKILFQGDLFYFDVGDYFPPRNRIKIVTFFAAWLKRTHLEPAEIYSVHGWGFATMAAVDHVLRLKP